MTGHTLAMTARTDPGRTLLTEIQSRCTVLYRQLAAGLDAPPSDRLRLEGMLETAHLLELAATEELDELLRSAYRESFAVSYTHLTLPTKA